MAEENPIETWNLMYRWHHIIYLILVLTTSTNNDKKYNLKVNYKHLLSYKKYMLQFGSASCCIHFFILYSMYMNFLVLEINPNK